MIHTDEFTLRPASPSDLPDLAEIFLAVRADAVPEMPALIVPADVVRDDIGGWSLEQKDVWVAEDALGISGFAAVTAEWLDGLYVLPARQGHGIGTALLGLVKSLRPKGFGLWVFASNAPARGFYRRHGLLELEHTDGSHFSELAPNVRMAWPGVEPMDYLRGQIDDVDLELAELLGRRFALTAAVQGQKVAVGGEGGHAGRDAGRESAIVERMVRHVPGLEAERVAPIMDAVIAESLTAWESRPR